MAKYEEDFYSWALNQAALLRAGRWAALDLEHLAEEVEALAKRDRRALESYLAGVLRHLLKWAYQPERRGRSWQGSLLEARHQLAKLLRDSPSLWHELPQLIGEAYPHARRRAALETGLPEATFPPGCPWRPEQILDENFLPEAIR